MLFKFRLKLKDCEQDFGLGPGLLVEQDVEYDINDGDLDNPMFLATLIRDGDEFMNKHVKVEFLVGIPREEDL